MSLTTILSIFSLAISIAAFVVSFVALWKTHLSKFSTIATVGHLRQRIFPIRSDKEKWYIFLFDVPISITNSGARAGKILGMRLSLHFPDVPIPNNREYIHASREVDPLKAGTVEKDFFKWLKEIEISDWIPFTVLPHHTVTKHLHFQTRWDDPVFQDNCICDLQIFTDTNSKWVAIAQWKIDLSKVVWSELLTHSNTIGFPAQGSPQEYPSVRPPDLHKYISSKEPIPKGGFGAGPSYVDWPENLPEPEDESESAA